MSDINYTPGPWKTHAQGDANEYCMLRKDGHWLAAIKFNGELSIVEQQANIRLIDAAPDMLEALELTLANLSPLYSKDHLVIERISSAIAKAKSR